MTPDADPRPTIVSGAAVAPAPAQERFHRWRLRQIIGAVAALAVVGGLGAGMVVTGAGGSASAATSAIGVDDGDGTGSSESDADGGDGTDGDPDAVAAQRLAIAVRAFTATLHSAQLAALGTAASGLRLGDLDTVQRAAALDVVRTALSAEGFAQLAAAMQADDELDAAVGGGSGWSSDDYAVTLLRSPDDGGFFLQFGGRQLAVTAISADGALVVDAELVGEG